MYSELGPHGDLLLAEFEAKKGGGMATEAYRCPGGRWTLGLGATEWPGGRLVGPHDVCTLEQAVALTNWSLRKFSAVVDGFIKKPMTQNQRAAFILLAYNIGPHAFRTDCTASHLFNSSAPNLAVAAAFGKWCKATNDKPEEYDLDDPAYMPIIGKNSKGEPCWVDRDGKPCDYRRALPGLLRRHLSEACLFMDLDWRQACPKRAISIISEREWDEKEGLWEDLVRKKTEFSDIEPVAKQYPLTNTGGKPSIAIAWPTEPVHESQPLPVSTERPAPQTAPAANADSSDVLILDRAASEAAPAAEDKGGFQPVPASQPVPAEPPADIEGVAAPPLPDKVPAPVELDSSVRAGQEGAAVAVNQPDRAPPPKASVVIAPKSVNIDAIPYGQVDPGNGAKNMTDSKRFVGMLIVGAGSLVQVLATREVITTTYGAVFYDLSRDPVLVAFAAAGVIWLIGWATRKRGQKVITDGMKSATQLLK